MTARRRKAEKFPRYDSADYLKTPEDVAEYLVAAL
jgi:DNA-binding phage protein